jgi:hypothetical protein
MAQAGATGYAVDVTALGVAAVVLLAAAVAPFVAPAFRFVRRAD